MLTRQTNVKKEVLFKVFMRIVLLFSYGKLQNFYARLKYIEIT